MARSFYAKAGLEFRDEVTDELVKLRGVVRKQAMDAVLSYASIVIDRAWELANVSAGAVGHAVDGRHMRDCIEAVPIETPTSVECKIGIDLSNVPYAAHQEFGQHGKPFLRPALDETRMEGHEIMRSVLLDGAEPRSSVRFRRFA